MLYQRIVWSILGLALALMMVNPADAKESTNKLFFQKEFRGRLLFVEATTDPDKGVGDPTASHLRHDYTSLLEKSGWQKAPDEYRNAAISCLIYEKKDSVLVGCWNNNPGDDLLALVVILMDNEIDSLINKAIELMIDKMIAPPSPREPSRDSLYCAFWPRALNSAGSMFWSDTIKS